MPKYRIAVINHRLQNCGPGGLGGWGWSMGEGNVPRQWSMAMFADIALLAMEESDKLRESPTFEYRIIEGPPFVLPEPQNHFHANRKELSHNS